MSANEKQNKISREDKYRLLGSTCCDRKQIESKMWWVARNSWCPSLLGLAEDANSQFKKNRVEARILFYPVRTFPNCRALHRDFFFFDVKWYIKPSFLRFFWLNLYGQCWSFLNDGRCWSFLHDRGRLSLYTKPYEQTKSKFLEELII